MTSQEMIQKAMQDPIGFGNQKTTREFIRANIDEILADIEYIEEQTRKILIGERQFLEKPYTDCKNMTNMQVIHFFSVWRAGIFARINQKY